MSEMKLVRAVQTKKSQFWNQWKSVLLLNLTLAVLGSTCYKKMTLDKDFIGCLLVYGPNIGVCRYPKTPWHSNAYCLNRKIKESKFREGS